MECKITWATDIERTHLRFQADLFIKILKQSFPNLKVKVITGGTIECTHMIDTGEADIAQIKNWQYLTAIRGKMPFTKKFGNLRAIMDYGSQGGVEHFAVSKDLNINSFSDIRGGKKSVRICTAREVTSSHHLTRLSLEAYGLSFDDLVAKGGAVAIANYPTMIDWIKKGVMNSIGASSYLPCSWTVALSKHIRLLSFDQNALKYLHKNYGMKKFVIPKKTYPFLERDLITFRDRDLLVARRDLSHEIVYSITKTLFSAGSKIKNTKLPEGSSMQEFNIKNATQGIGPLHEGAVQFFRESAS